MKTIIKFIRSCVLPLFFLTIGFYQNTYAQASYADFKVPELVCEGLEYEFENTSYLKPGDTATYLWSFEDALSQNTSSGTMQWEHLSEYRTVTATLTMYLQNGDSSVQSKNIEVLRRPFADFETGSFCEGEEAIFTNKTITHASEDVSYIWLSEVDGDNHWPIRHLSRIEEISLISKYTNGCTDTITKPATVNAAPDAVFDVWFDVDKWIFDANTNHSIYLWTFSNGMSGKDEDLEIPYDSFINPAEVTVCLKTKNDECWAEYCRPLMSADINVSTYNELEINVYPTPTIDHLNVSSAIDLRFKLYDLQGKEMEINEVMHNSDTYTLQIDLPSGVYVLKAIGESGSFTKKIMVE